MNEGKRSRRWLLAALAACVFSPLVGSPALAACDIEDHCSGDPPVCTCPESPECVVGTIQTIPAGGTVDCDGIDIRIVANNGRIEVYDGFVTVRARDLRIDGGQAIRAFRSADNGIPFGVNVELTGTADIRGRVEANSSWGGGAVRIDTAGDMLFPNTGGGVAVEARGTLANAPGGEIELDSDGDIVIEEAIYADTPDGTYTGVAEGGDVEIRAAGTVTVDALIKVFGRETQAGSVRITSEGRIGANGLPLEDPEAVACGSADQTSKIVVDGNILAEGGNKNGHGGEIELTARRIEVNDKLSAQGGLNVGGGLSEGGSVQIAAGDCGVALNDQIDVTGGEGGSGMSGGAIVVESAGDVSVAAGALLNTRADANGGDGGGIIITAEGDLTIGAGATLDARGHTGGGGEGSGAPIDLRACNLSIAADVTIDSTGYEGGTVELTGREQVTIAASASVDATGPTDDDDGEIILRTPPGACAHDADLQCSASAECEHGCTSGTCQTQPPPGVCENNPLQSCTSNVNCGSGCSTGTCLFGTCTNDTTVHCDTDAMCEDLGCQSGTCDVRHDTGGTTAQFDPPPQLEQDAGLAACG